MSKRDRKSRDCSTRLDKKCSYCHNVFMPKTMTDDAAAVRRARILTAARWCFLNFGFSKTAFEDIAKRANLSRTPAHGSGATWIASPSSQWTHILLASLPAHSLAFDDWSSRPSTGWHTSMAFRPEMNGARPSLGFESRHNKVAKQLAVFIDTHRPGGAASGETSHRNSAGRARSSCDFTQRERRAR